MRTNSWVIFLLLLSANQVVAQIEAANPLRFQEAINANVYVIPIDKSSIRGSYPLGVSDIKTVHIVFPNEIKEVDAGSADVIAQITPSFANVLKLKAAVNKPFEETNLTVLTSTGGLYSFLLTYNSQPELLNITISSNENADKKSSRSLGINPLITNKLLLNDLNVSQNEIDSIALKVNELPPIFKQVGVENLTIKATLKGIYAKHDLFFFSIELSNESYVDYPIDFIKMYVKDKKQLKRTAIQEEELKIPFISPSINKIVAQQKQNFSIVLPAQTLANDKVFWIEIYEKNGGRHLRFEISPKQVIKAKNL